LIEWYEKDAKQLRKTSDFKGAEMCYKEIRELKRRLKGE